MAKRINKTGKKSIKGAPTKQKQKKATHSQKASDYKEPKRLDEYEAHLQGPPKESYSPSPQVGGRDQVLVPIAGSHPAVSAISNALSTCFSGTIGD